MLYPICDEDHKYIMFRSCLEVNVWMRMLAELGTGGKYITNIANITIVTSSTNIINITTIANIGSITH